MSEKPESHFHLSVVIDGATFSASGPKEEVLRLYTEWKSMAGLEDEPHPRTGFNSPRIVKAG